MYVLKKVICSRAGKHEACKRCPDATAHGKKAPPCSNLGCRHDKAASEVIVDARHS